MARVSAAAGSADHADGRERVKADVLARNREAAASQKKFEWVGGNQLK